MNDHDRLLTTLGFGIGVLLALSVVSVGLLKLGSPLLFCLGALALLGGGLLMFMVMEQGR